LRIHSSAANQLGSRSSTCTASIATIRVIGNEKSVSDQVPNDIGEPGLITRSMWWNRSGSPRSSTSIRRSMSSRTSATGYASFAAGATVPGATNSAMAATRNRPVARILKNTSRATSPCQLGALVTSPDA
jgi:hypothetical protein